MAKLFCSHVSAEAGGLHWRGTGALGPGTSSAASLSAAAAPGPAVELQPASARPNSSQALLAKAPRLISRARHTLAERRQKPSFSVHPREMASTGHSMTRKANLAHPPTLFCSCHSNSYWVNANGSNGKRARRKKKRGEAE